MKTYSNRNRWAGGFVPPFVLLKGFFLIGILFSTFFYSQAQSPVNVELPTMEFKKGTAELTDEAQIPNKIAIILQQFHVLEPMVKDPLREADNYVLFVKIRTDRTEAGNSRAPLCLARAAAIRKLLLKTSDDPKDPLLEIEELRIHSAIAYNNEPTGVWFEIQTHRGKITQIQLTDSLLTQLTGQ